MNPAPTSRPAILIIMIVLLILLGLGGLAGGIAMFADPSGEAMGLSPELLESLPISDFIFPGIFLVVIIGIVPMLIAWGLWKGLPWAWIAAVAQSILLILWICFQVLLWQKPIAIQVVYLIWGVVMLILCFLPGMRRSQG